MGSDELNLAASFIRDGQKQAARRLLIPYVKAHPRDAHAWMLLSYAIEDPSKKIDCVRRALKIAPGSAQAQKRLKTLLDKMASTASAERPPAPDKTPPFLKRGKFAEADQDDEPATARKAEVPEWAKSIPPIEPRREQPERSSLRRQASETTGSTEPATKPSNLKPFLLIAVAIICFISLVGGVVAYPSIQELYSSFQTTRSAARVERVASQLGTAQPTLPPSWTPTPEPTITPTRTITPTITQTLPPTLVPPSEGELEEMQAIQIEVADLRGLSVSSGVQNYLVDKGRVRPILEELYFSSGGTEAEVEDQKRSLIALGLVKPTYDLFDNILNNIADGIGGFYDPLTDEIYVLGFIFGGVEHYIYAHEFDHALVDQHYPLDGYGNYPICLTNE
ncbi:MAG: hypothetical protein PVI04_07675, partial [Anaerolineales bacterium]